MPGAGAPAHASPDRASSGDRGHGATPGSPSARLRLGQERRLVDQHPGQPARPDQPVVSTERSVADTVKMSRRPSTRSKVASAVTVAPDGDRGQVVELDPAWPRWSSSGARWPSRAPGSWPPRTGRRAGGWPSTGDAPRCAGPSAVSARPTVEARPGRRGRPGPTWWPREIDCSEAVWDTTITIPPVTDAPLVEPPVLERVLDAALRRGGDFAEVFVEDRQHVVGRARRRAGRGAVVGPRPGRRDPGGRRRDDRVRPHRRPVRGRPAGRGRGGRGRWPARVEAGVRTGRVAEPAGPWPPSGRDPARRRGQGGRSSSSWRGPTRRPGRRAAP